jgi:hypothetical protein
MILLKIRKGRLENLQISTEDSLQGIQRKLQFQLSRLFLAKEHKVKLRL